MCFLNFAIFTLFACPPIGKMRNTFFFWGFNEGGEAFVRMWQNHLENVKVNVLPLKVSLYVFLPTTHSQHNQYFHSCKNTISTWPLAFLDALASPVWMRYSRSVIVLIFLSLYWLYWLLIDWIYRKLEKYELLNHWVTTWKQEML